MTRACVLGLLSLLALLALDALVALDSPLRAQEAPAREAHRFRATQVVGAPLDAQDPLGDLRGRAVLLVFLASWYERCAEAVPHLNKLHDELGPEGLTVLGVAEQDVETLGPWRDEHGMLAPVALIDTAVADELKRHYEVPGFPHGHLVDPAGRIVWSGHPQSLKPPAARRFLVGVTRPPRLPAAFAKEQALLDDGRWAAARTALLARVAAGGLDRAAAHWATGTAEWIERRAEPVLDEAEAEYAAGRAWDAWQVFDDFPRRFEGLPGVERAQERAAAIRADPEARADLELGDDVAKARGLAPKNPRAAKLLLERVLRTGRGTRHAERAKTLLATLE